MKETTLDLLERFAQGELEAFETVFRQFQGEVFGWIVRIVRTALVFVFINLHHPLFHALLSTIGHKVVR